MRRSAFFALVSSLVLQACSSSSTPSATPADSGAPDTSDTSDASDASDSGSPDTSADASAEAGAVTTSASCGSIAVLGPQGAQVSAACVACANSKCCSQGSACGADSECVAYRDCVAACADSACSQTCAATHASGTSASDAFATCRNSSCAQECADLACVGNVTWPAPTATTIDVTYVLQSYKDGSAVVGATVKACNKSDAACASPIAQATSDASGSVTLTMPTSPDGVGAYLDITASGFANTLLFASFADNQKIYAKKKLYPTLLDQATVDAFSSIAGASADPTRGHVAFLALDCGGNRLGGVSVTASTADASTKTAYIAGSVPSASATATDASGTGGIFDLPAGAVTIDAKLQPAGTRFGALPVIVRAGYLTTMNVVPTP